MLKLHHMIFAPEEASAQELRAHRIYLGVCLTLIGCGIGLLTLLLSAYAYPSLPCREMLYSYFSHPLLIALNLLPAIVLVWLGYFLFAHAWCGVLLSGVPLVGGALVNYYKIALRGDPLLASDILLLRTAKGIMGHYTFDITRVVVFSVGMLVLALVFSIFLMPRGDHGKRLRLIGTAVCLALGAGLYFGAYASDEVYQRAGNDGMINVWSDTEVYISRGFTLSFFHSVPDMLPKTPEGYDPDEAQALLLSFSDADIPEDQKIIVMGIMMEAYCDLTDFDVLAQIDAVQEVYAPWHAIAGQSISGRLLTNIFAGGTVDTEWGYLTGASAHDDYNSDTGSYVRYFNDQGYATHYAHPGYGWFYDRENINSYLGFSQSVFTENGFGKLVNPVAAAWHSDKQLVDYLLRDLDEAEGSPLFSFAVSYQNHGPYDSDVCYGKEYVPAETGLSTESRNIINNYLGGVADTLREYERFVQELEKRETPIVLVLFGDHKPWLGNDNAVYRELGIDFDVSTFTGFHNYYATPYLIWANSAAKSVLGSNFTGDGGEFSPCFLMPRLFDACGWEGPGFMQLARHMRDISPLVHVRGLFLQGGVLTSVLDDTDRAFYRDFLSVQYEREHSFTGAEETISIEKESGA